MSLGYFGDLITFLGHPFLTIDNFTVSFRPSVKCIINTDILSYCSGVGLGIGGRHITTIILTVFITNWSVEYPQLQYQFHPVLQCKK